MEGFRGGRDAPEQRNGNDHGQSLVQTPLAGLLRGDHLGGNVNPMFDQQRQPGGCASLQELLRSYAPHRRAPRRCPGRRR